MADGSISIALIPTSPASLTISNTHKHTHTHTHTWTLQVNQHATEGVKHTRHLLAPAPCQLALVTLIYFTLTKCQLHKKTPVNGQFHFRAVTVKWESNGFYINYTYISPLFSLSFTFLSLGALFLSFGDSIFHPFHPPCSFFASSLASFLLRHFTVAWT